MSPGLVLCKFTLCIFIFFSSAFSQFVYGSDKPYSLGDAVTDAIGSDPRVELALAETTAAEVEVDLARGGYYPSISAQAGAVEFSGETEYSLNMRQMLYDWGRVSSKVGASEADTQFSRENLRLTQATVAYDTADTYLSYYQSKNIIEIYDDYIFELNELIRIANERFEGRFSSRVEVDRAILEKARATETQGRYWGWMAVAREDLLEFTGRDPQSLTLVQPPELPILDTYKNRAVDWNGHVNTSPKVTTELAEVERAQAELALTKAELWPQVSLEADWTRREFNDEIDSDVIVAIRVRSDTYFGLSNFRRPDAAKKRLEARKYEVTLAMRDLRRAIQQLAAMQPAMEGRLEALVQQAESAGEIAEVYQQQFIAGLRDFDDLLTVIRDRYEARRQSEELRSELLRLQYGVAADFGVLEAMLSGKGMSMHGNP